MSDGLRIVVADVIHTAIRDHISGDAQALAWQAAQRVLDTIDRHGAQPINRFDNFAEARAGGTVMTQTEGYAGSGGGGQALAESTPSPAVSE